MSVMDDASRIHDLPEAGVSNYRPTSRFSVTYTPKRLYSPRVRLKIITSQAVRTPGVVYGPVPMTYTGSPDVPGPSAEYHYEIVNPPAGSQVITGIFSEDVLYVARVFDDASASPVQGPRTGISLQCCQGGSQWGHDRDCPTLP